MAAYRAGAFWNVPAGDSGRRQHGFINTAYRANPFATRRAAFSFLLYLRITRYAPSHLSPSAHTPLRAATTFATPLRCWPYLLPVLFCLHGANLNSRTREGTLFYTHLLPFSPP